MEMLDGPRFGPATGAAPDALVVLVHGFGADGHDLIDLAAMWAEAVPGALFFIGDCHATQGDGEIAGTGIETCFEVEIRLMVEKGRSLVWPRGESADEVRLRLTGDVALPPGKIVVESPLARPLRAVLVNGKPVETFTADHAVVGEFPADVLLRYQPDTGSDVAARATTEYSASTPAR